MLQDEANDLIRSSFEAVGRPQHWLDLGSGSGIFTYAIAGLLPMGSKVTAIDKADNSININYRKGIEIKFIEGDFTNEIFDSQSVDGIFMANALHYVKDQQSFIKKLKARYPEMKKMVIIEYGSPVPNQWVPYPVPFSRLQTFFEDLDVKNLRKIAERDSVYSKINMYVAEISF